MKFARCWPSYRISQYNEYLLKVLSVAHLVQVVTSSENDHMPSYSPSKSLYFAPMPAWLTIKQQKKVMYYGTGYQTRGGRVLPGMLSCILEEHKYAERVKWPIESQMPHFRLASGLNKPEKHYHIYTWPVFNS